MSQVEIKTVLFDMDGLLVNFINGALMLHGRNESHDDITEWDFYKSWGITTADFFRDMVFGFWKNLKPYAWAQQLADDVWDTLNAVGGDSESVTWLLCTSPCLTDGCIDGKRAWAEANGWFANAVVPLHDKHVLATPHTLLIDDKPENVNSFRAAGGHAILFPQKWNRKPGEDVPEDRVAYVCEEIRKLLAPPEQIEPINKPLTLRVGGKYLARNGVVVEIKRESHGDFWGTFTQDYSRWTACFKADGINYSIPEHSLVSEVIGGHKTSGHAKVPFKGIFTSTTPPKTAARNNEGKPDLSQLLHFRLEALAAHCTAGREKYPDVDGVPNWTLGGKPDEEYTSAAMRHLTAMARGMAHDRETGTLHAAAVAWNMLALITNNYTDVPVRQPVAS